MARPIEGEEQRPHMRRDSLQGLQPRERICAMEQSVQLFSEEIHGTGVDGAEGDKT